MGLVRSFPGKKNHDGIGGHAVAICGELVIICQCFRRISFKGKGESIC